MDPGHRKRGARTARAHLRGAVRPASRTSIHGASREAEQRNSFHALDDTSDYAVAFRCFQERREGFSRNEFVSTGYPSGRVVYVSFSPASRRRISRVIIPTFSWTMERLNMFVLTPSVCPPGRPFLAQAGPYSNINGTKVFLCPTSVTLLYPSTDPGTCRLTIIWLSSASSGNSIICLTDGRWVRSTGPHC